MAERKSQNKYYPPDWDPSKGSVNKHFGQHPLRDRAKKISQGILVIRFEMPYNIWCGGCNSHIGMGVRYNAEKKKVGKYYSTPIWQFRMKCHLCDNYFEIQTDPQHHDYVITSGARRKEQRWKPEENEQIATEDKAVIKKMANDPMFKLEHTSDDVKKSSSVQLSVGQLEKKRSEFQDDYSLNKLARSKFREEKKAQKKTQMEDKELLQKSSLNISLLPKSEEDTKLASLLKYKSLETYDEKQAERRREIESQTIFQQSSNKGKDLVRHKLAASNSKNLGFTTEAINFKTLKETQRLLGIQRRNKKNALSKQQSLKTQTLNKNSDCQERLTADKGSVRDSDCQAPDSDMNSDCPLKLDTDRDSTSERGSSTGLSSSEDVKTTGASNMDQSTDSLDISTNVSTCSINTSSLSLVGVYQNSDSECDST
eukprot:XP_011443995.1 PREDICTED: coiled-coil domain-containing protein 130 homolog [Crassostrea gigas]